MAIASGEFINCVLHAFLWLIHHMISGDPEINTEMCAL